MKKLSPKQKAIAAKAPPPDKIDAKDFAVLKAEKAKGRGMGLQDEKVKPGKVMKAALGAVALGKSMKDEGKAMPLGFGAVFQKNKKMKELLGKKSGGVMKARDGKSIKKDPTKPVNPFQKKPKTKSKLPGRIGTALGIGAMMVPAAYAAAKQYKDYKSAKNRDEVKVKNKKMVGGMAKKYSVGGGADMGKKNKKSKSGSSVKDIFKSYGKYDGKPIELSKGGGADTGKMGEIKSQFAVASDRVRRTKRDGDRLTQRDIDFINKQKQRTRKSPERTPGPKTSTAGRLTTKDILFTTDKSFLEDMKPPRGAAPGKFKSGTMVKARGCKLGRTRPTKIT